MKSFFDHHGIDEWELDDQDDEDGSRRTLRCDRCGSADVRWRRQGGRWVLFTLQPGIVHTCSAPNADAFGVEDVD